MSWGACKPRNGEQAGIFAVASACPYACSACVSQRGTTSVDFYFFLGSQMVLFSLLVVIVWPMTDTWLFSAVGTEVQKQKAKACSSVGQFWTLPHLNHGSLRAVSQGTALLKDGCCSGASGEVAEPRPSPCACALLSLRRRALQHRLKA